MNSDFFKKQHNMYHIIFAAVIVIHIIAVFYLFGVINIFNLQPIYNYDCPYHLYYINLASHYHPLGHSWGYNPFFNAGYPTASTLDNALLQLLASSFSFIGKVVIMKLWITLFLCALPVIAFFTVKNFGFDSKRSLAGMVLFILYLHTDFFLNSLVRYGMFNYTFSVILSVFFISLFYSYMKENKHMVLLSLICIFPFFPLVHSSTLLNFYVPMLLLFFLHLRTIKKEQIVFITLILAMGLTVSSIWIIGPFYVYIKPYVGNTAKFFQMTKLKFLISDFFFANGAWTWGFQLIKLVIIIFGIAGLVQLYRSNKKLFIWFVSVIVLFFIVTYLHFVVGIFKFIAQLQPYKYVVTFILLLIIPASVSLISLQEKKILRKKYISSVIILFLLFLVVFVRFSSAKISKRVYFNNYYFKLLGSKFYTSPPEDYASILDWIKTNTTNKARILFEHNLTGKQLFEKPSYSYGLMALKSHRQFLGGPHKHGTMKNTQWLNSFRIMDIPWFKLSDEHLKRKFEEYNVGWIIARSPFVIQNLLKKVTLVEAVHKVKKFRIFKVKRDFSFIINGIADVSFTINKLMVKNIASDQGEIILKYHYIPTLKTQPSAEIKPLLLPGHKVPFIQLKVGTLKNITIYNSYKK